MSIRTNLSTIFKGVAMEDDAVLPEVVAQTDEYETLDEQLETNITDTDAEVEFAEVTASIEYINNSITGLECLHVAVGKTQADGGMDKQAAALLTIALESILKDYGIKIEKVIPAMESFDDASSCIGSTAVTMEGIGDAIAKMWKGLKETMGKLLDSFHKATKSAKEHIKRVGTVAAALAVKASSKTGSTPKDKSLEVEHAGFVMNGNTFTGLTPKGIATIGSGSVVALNKNMVQHSMEYVEVIASYASKFQSDFTLMGDALKEAIKKINAGIMKDGEKYTESGRTYFAMKNTTSPGDFRTYYYANINNNEPDNVLDIWNESIESVESSNRRNGTTYHDVLNPEEIAALCNAIADAAAKVYSEKDSDKDMIRVFRTAYSVADELEAKIVRSNEASGAARNSVRYALRNLYTVCGNAVGHTRSSFRHINLVLYYAYKFAKKSYYNLN